MGNDRVRTTRSAAPLPRPSAKRTRTFVGVVSIPTTTCVSELGFSVCVRLPVDVLVKHLPDGTSPGRPSGLAHTRRGPYLL